MIMFVFLSKHNQYFSAKIIELETPAWTLYFLTLCSNPLRVKCLVVPCNWEINSCVRGDGEHINLLCNKLGSHLYQDVYPITSALASKRGGLISAWSDLCEWLPLNFTLASQNLIWLYSHDQLSVTSPRGHLGQNFLSLVCLRSLGYIARRLGEMPMVRPRLISDCPQ